MDLNDPRVKRMNDYLDKMSEEDIRLHNEKELAKNDADFEKLKSSLAYNECCYCGYSLTHFSLKKPCLHWLLKPKGFKKKHFPILYEIKSFHEIETYLRWVANTELLIRNINDLEDEKSPSKIIEETIKFKNLEWSFSCSKGDMEGHAHKHHGKYPHYHFQMKVDGNVVINFDGFHIPFHDYDDYCFAMKNGLFNRAKHEHLHAAGMQKVFDHFTPEELLDQMNSSNIKEGEKAPFHLQTILIADEGTTMSGEEIAKIMEESKKTGIPIAKLAKKIKNAKIQTIISAGPEIPEMAKRSSR